MMRFLLDSPRGFIRLLSQTRRHSHDKSVLYQNIVGVVTCPDQEQQNAHYSSPKKMKNTEIQIPDRANQAHALDGGIPSPLHVACRRPAASDGHRWAALNACSTNRIKS